MGGFNLYYLLIFIFQFVLDEHALLLQQRKRKFIFNLRK